MIYMVMKPSFKYFKNKKTNVGLKQETLLYQNIFISFYKILSIYIDLDSNKKKISGCLKNMQFINSFI